MPRENMQRLQVDGKFFRAGGRRVFLKMVTYGPFPEPLPEHLAQPLPELQRIRQAGFNAIRLYHEPDLALLGAAAEAGLWVFAGLSWDQGRDFISQPSLLAEARLKLDHGLKSWGQHPALAGLLVGNEIPADMVRWMGVNKVRRVIEQLIEQARAVQPDRLYGYASFPTTEFLEPSNADFTAMNVYLEQREQFAAYLPRLHNVAGDRPVLLSEFGLDTRRGGEDRQSEVLQWAFDESLSAGMAGLTIYSWSDCWLNGQRVMTDWDFGLTDRQGREKPAFHALAAKLPSIQQPEDGLNVADGPMFSVVVCTYNGAHRMHRCLAALTAMTYPHYEIIVVDDGSDDDLEQVVAEYDQVRLISIEHGGLSVARNVGAKAARGEIIAYTDDDCEPDAAWLMWLAHAFGKHGWDACGGPNLPPEPAAEGHGEERLDEAVVASAPGAPSHVLLGDQQAEHLPGCNLVVKKDAFVTIGGFDGNYRVAGDDVDFCWRLSKAGFRMGFHGAAFVWHRRRTSLWRYFKQQYGYGKAEALLMRDHPERFRRAGGARWQGHVYAGGAMCADQGSVIYHGPMGTAGYQQLVLTMQPQRPLRDGYSSRKARRRLALAENIQPWIRSFSRWWFSLGWRSSLEKVPKRKSFILVDSMETFNEYESKWWSASSVSRIEVLEELTHDGWCTLENDSDWDLERNGLRLLLAEEVLDDGRIFLARMECSASSRGRLPADFTGRLESLGLTRI
ncbi:glycosyltransferase [Verrucomicrobiaceae bacterium R5-34]|nr:glycosyltransferase [Verrucomicrobiaceae bacterium R5-34]